MGFARKLYEASAAEVWRAVRRRALGRHCARESVAPRRFEPVTRAFLLSAEYRRLMAEHLPQPGAYDRHEAQNETRSYRFRHAEASERLGVFRWRGIQEHLDEVLSLVDGEGALIDFGGGACPVGFQTQVVDRLEQDGYERPVRFCDVEDVPGLLDGIFTSHTLEHVAELDSVLAAFARTLRPGGRLIAHLPAFSCVRWRAGEHAHALYHDHAWTFGLAGDEPEGGLKHYCDIELMVSRHLIVERAEYCGDDSIFLSARRAESAAI